MSSSASPPRSALPVPTVADTTSTSKTVLLFLGASIALHAGAFVLLNRLPPPSALKSVAPVELVMFEVEPPAPPPPPPPAPPEPVKVAKVKPPPIQVNSTQAPPPKVAEDLPPPPNEEPPPSTPVEPKPILITGVQYSSTSTGGSFAAPVGNTAYGKPSQVATAPKDVKPYAAPKYAPIYQVDTQPVVLSEYKPPYPERARQAGIEGVVVLSIAIDSTGKVTEAKILKGPGYGLEEAALEGIRRFKFKPATKHGEAVATEITFSYRFYLD